MSTAIVCHTDRPQYQRFLALGGNYIWGCRIMGGPESIIAGSVTVVLRNCTFATGGEDG